MVLRKPYAFLIRYFRLIHAILLGLMILFAINMNSLYQFFKEYVNMGIYHQIIDVFETKFSIWIFFWQLLILIITIAMTVLLKTKKKPIKSYLAMSLVYFLAYVAIILSIISLNSIQFDKASVQLLSITRDFTMLFTYLSIPFMLMVLARTVGFNVKQFNFKKDLDELDIDEADRAEFEVELELDSADFKSKLKRQARVLGYVYKENKLFFKIILGIAIAILLSSIYIYFEVVNKVYREGSSFNSGAFNIKVLASYQLEAPPRKEIVRDENLYLVVKLRMKNRSKYEQLLPDNKKQLRIMGKGLFDPYERNNNDFALFGHPLIEGKKLAPKESLDFIVVYKIDKEYEKISKRFEYLDQIKRKGREVKYLPKVVQLRFKKANNKAKITATKKLGEELSFKSSYLKDSSIKINKYETADRFYHRYIEYNTITKEEKELIRIIKSDQKLLGLTAVAKVEYEMKLDEKINKEAVSRFFERYGKLTYKYNDQVIENSTALFDIETSKKNDYSYFQIDNDVMYADEVYIDITLWDKTYRYYLK